MKRLFEILEQTLMQWKLHIEEMNQEDIEDITTLEALEWKKLNAEVGTLKANMLEAVVRQGDSQPVLPSVDDAGAIAVSLSEKLTEQEQAFFIAGFQECIKYLLARQSA